MFYCDRCESNEEKNCKCGYASYLIYREKFIKIYDECQNNISKIFTHDLNEYFYNIKLIAGLDNYKYNLNIDIDKLNYENTIREINFINIKLNDISRVNTKFTLHNDFYEIRNKYGVLISETQKLLNELINVINEFNKILIMS